MDDGGGFSLPLLIIIILTIVNGLFSAAEMALISSNKGKIQEKEEDGSRKARLLLKVTSKQKQFLSTIQVGIVLTGFYSAGLAAKDLAPYMARHWGLHSGLAFVLVIFVLSFFSILFGELIPKRIALRAPEKVGLSLVSFVEFFRIISLPFVGLLSILTGFFLKITGNYSDDVEEQISEEELKSYIRVGKEQGVINLSGEEMMVSIMDFDDIKAYEIMTPRTDLYMIDYDEFTTDTISEMLKTGYSRAPVYQEDTDNIIGTIYIKDIFVEYAKSQYKTINIDKILKEPYFVPESKNVDRLLKELQSTKNYIAILIDEYGGFSGMVTMEDIVEEIVGDIEDEYDTVDQGIEQINAHTYIIDGSMDLDDINDAIHTDFASENHETLSGLTIELLGFIPDKDDKQPHQVIYKNQNILTVLSVKDKRIEKVQVECLDQAKH